MAPVDRLTGLDAPAGGPGSHGRHRAAAPGGGKVAHARRADVARPAGEDFFTRFAIDYVTEHRGRPICVVQAGCATAGPELDLEALIKVAPDVIISRVDDDNPIVRAVAARKPELSTAAFSELRMLALTPRSVDLIQCSLLLHRVRNAELVLDRLVAALRPGGLMFLRTTDRDTTAGFIDRKLPQFARELSWRAAQPGEPGPFPACYEPIVSARGIEAFVVRQGLAIAHRQTWRSQDGAGWPRAHPALQFLARLLSHDRLIADYEELRYVLRRPEDRFARVLSS